ncbi:hypothetical protein AAF712_009339 [Marasmius tenuissimus]|uniref:Uncharacterized protein n=1 Tax=Marasmius tenuissimus TaxID=585030 RepID=A0ABR2ZQ28_9AGAR
MNQQEKNHFKRVHLEVNRLGRRILHKALGVSSNLEAAHCLSVEANQLLRFREDPGAHRPGVENTGLDLSGTTLQEWRDSAWNRALIDGLAAQARRLAVTSDTGTYEQCYVDWNTFFTNRVYRIFLSVEKVRKMRFGEVYRRKQRQNARRRALGTKFQRRLRMAGVMLNKSRAERDEDAVDFWAYVLRALSTLTPDGMSDEEDGFDSTSGRPIKIVSTLEFRHPDFCKLFGWVDNVRFTRKDTFVQAGSPRLERVPASSAVVTREPPPHLPLSFLTPQYRSEMREMGSVRGTISERCPSEYVAYLPPTRT